MIKYLVLSVFSLLILVSGAPVAYSATAHSGTKIFLAPQGGFETYLAAAFTKKHLLARIVGEVGQSDYVLEAAPVAHKPETAGSKVARCLFLYCAGIEGSESTSARLIDEKTKETVWSYTVNKGHQREQSLAEAVAKHLANEFINKP